VEVSILLQANANGGAGRAADTGGLCRAFETKSATAARACRAPSLSVSHTNSPFLFPLLALRVSSHPWQKLL
jgi:hypothetical protein